MSVMPRTKDRAGLWRMSTTKSDPPLEIAEAAEAQRQAQCPPVARVAGRVSGHLGHPTQAVPNGVRVHEQCTGGRLERAAALDESGQRLRQCRIRLLDR